VPEQPVRTVNDRFFASRRREILLVAGVALLMVAALRMRSDALVYDHADFLNPWDHHKYIWMATHNPFDFHVAPFCWRVTTPALASALPFGVEKSFLIISYLSLWLTGVAMYFLARRFRFSKWTSFAGMILFFSLGWAVKANLYNIWRPEPLAFLLATLAIYCIADGKQWRYAALLALGVTVNESVLFVIPLYYSLNAKKPVDPRLALRAVLLALPALAVFAALRSLIPMQNDDIAYMSTLPEALRQAQLGSTSYDLGSLWNEIGLQRLRSLSPQMPMLYTVGTFGVVAAMLPLFAVRRNLPLFVRFLPFLLLVYAQLLIATNEMRLLVMAFPAVIILALNGAEAMAGVLRVRTGTVAILFGALVCLLLVRTWMNVLPALYESLLFLLYLAICFSYRSSRTTR